jgi:hypothetical protein
VDDEIVSTRLELQQPGRSKQAAELVARGDEDVAAR